MYGTSKNPNSTLFDFSSKILVKFVKNWTILLIQVLLKLKHTEHKKKICTFLIIMLDYVLYELSQISIYMILFLLYPRMKCLRFCNIVRLVPTLC